MTNDNAQKHCKQCGYNLPLPKSLHNPDVELGFCSGICQNNYEHEQILTDNKRYREALEFYRTKGNYLPKCVEVCPNLCNPNNITNDNGGRADYALYPESYLPPETTALASGGGEGEKQ